MSMGCDRMYLTQLEDIIAKPLSHFQKDQGKSQMIKRGKIYPSTKIMLFCLLVCFWEGKKKKKRSSRKKELQKTKDQVASPQSLGKVCNESFCIFLMSFSTYMKDKKETGERQCGFTRLNQLPSVMKRLLQLMEESSGYPSTQTFTRCFTLSLKSLLKIVRYGLGKLASG